MYTNFTVSVDKNTDLRILPKHLKGSENILKKKIIIASSVVILLLGGLLFYLVFRTGTPVVTPKGTYSVNYNNYQFNTMRLDHKDGKFAWVDGIWLTIADSGGKTDRHFYRGTQFQLYRHGVVYLDNGKLELCETGKKSVVIASDVSDFIVKDDSIIYDDKNDLYSYDITSNTSKKLAENVISFCVSGDKLIVLSNNPNGGLMDTIFTVYSNGVAVETLNFTVPYIPFKFMAAGDNIVFESDNSIIFLNIKTGERGSIALSERTTQDKIRYILNDDVLYVSYQARKYNGSLVSDLDHEDNGVWKVDLSTREKVKISDKTFDELYLFGDMLVLVKANDIFYLSEFDSVEPLIKK